MNYSVPIFLLDTLPYEAQGAIIFFTALLSLMSTFFIAARVLFGLAFCRGCGKKKKSSRDDDESDDGEFTHLPEGREGASAK